MTLPNAPVFGIGFQKTATTSLGDALDVLGYRVTGPFGWNDPDIRETALSRALNRIEGHDAAQDFPWAVLFRALDAHFPDATFILTTRDAEAWFNSMVRHFGMRSTPMRKWVYGAPYPRRHRSTYVQRMKRHEQEVKAYFAGRPDDLLVMDITQGDGWEVLCPFLGHEIPSQPFPCSNDAQERRMGRIQRYLQSPFRSLSTLVRMYGRTLLHELTGNRASSG